jgi:hypothetical protein
MVNSTSWRLRITKGKNRVKALNSRKRITSCFLLIIFCLINSTPSHADFKQKTIEKIVQGTEKVGEELHQILALAKEMGFFVNEVRFEISLTPRVEVFFRDVGDKGNLNTVMSKANKAQQAVLRLLQSTRKFNVAHYSPTGVKLVTGVAKPSVEILASYDE